VRAVIILEDPQSPETEKTPAIVFFEEKKGALPENPFASGGVVT
jgi:hypothetical protein